jgi:SAM-dependent methyltransferase
MLYTRYHLASQFCTGGEILEVACGTGIGLGLLATRAKSVVAGDIDPSNCAVARSTYASNPRIRIVQLDAEKLPFTDGSFDAVILFEALYYLQAPELFFKEARRVLRPSGVLLMATVNCEWDGFNPSPFSTRYFSAVELTGALSSCGFDLSMMAGFPEDTRSPLRQAIALVRRIAVKMRLIPRTMKGKQALKRLFYGKMTPIPRELSEGITQPEPLIPLAEAKELRIYRQLYAIARPAAAQGAHS